MTGRIRVPDDTAGNLIHSSHSPVWASVRVADYTSKWIVSRWRTQRPNRNLASSARAVPIGTYRFSLHMW
jgi:hypothetical protein